MRPDTDSTWHFARDVGGDAQNGARAGRPARRPHVDDSWQCKAEKDLPFGEHFFRFSLSSTQTAVMATVSRAVLSKWLSETTGDQIGTTMEKQCVISCPHSPTLSSPFAHHSSCVAARLFSSSPYMYSSPSPLQMEVLDAGL